MSVHQCLFSQHRPGGVSRFQPGLQPPEASAFSSHLETEKDDFMVSELEVTDR